MNLMVFNLSLFDWTEMMTSYLDLQKKNRKKTGLKFQEQAQICFNYVP